jgi:hypothetical protein
MNYGPLRALAGALLGLAFIVVVRRALRQDEHPAVFASMSGLDARKALLIVGVMTLHSFTEGVGIEVSFGGGQVLGLFISLALAVHNIPEGLAINLVLVLPGVGWVRAALWSIFSSMAQPLMAVPAVLRRDLPAAAVLRVGLRGGGHDLDGFPRARTRCQRGSFEQPRSDGDHGLSRRHSGFSGPYPVGISTFRSTRRNAAEDSQHGWDKPSRLLKKSCLCDSRFPV